MCYHSRLFFTIIQYSTHFKQWAPIESVAFSIQFFVDLNLFSFKGNQCSNWLFLLALCANFLSLFSLQGVLVQTLQVVVHSFYQTHKCSSDSFFEFFQVYFFTLCKHWAICDTAILEDRSHYRAVNVF